MTDYRFDPEQISQHVVKYGLDLRPAVRLDADRAPLNDHANWLISQYGALFETLISGPDQVRVNKTFVLPDGRRVEIPTFAMTARGPVYVFPRRLFIGQRHDLDTAAADQVVLAGAEHLAQRLPDRSLVRAALVHEIVFDTGQTNSVDLVCTRFSNPNWHQGVKNARIQIEISRTGKFVNLEIRPTFLHRPGREGPQDVARYGVLVGAEITIAPSKEPLTQVQLRDLLAFSAYYVPKDLVAFLNGS